MTNRNFIAIGPALHRGMARVPEHQCHFSDTPKQRDNFRMGFHSPGVRPRRTFVNVENGRLIADTQVMSDPPSTGVELLKIKNRLRLSLDAIARTAGYRGRSSVQRYFSTDFTAPLPPEAAVALSRGLDGKGSPPVTADEILALSFSEVLVPINRMLTEKLTVKGTVEAGIWREQTDWPGDEQYEIDVGPPPFGGAKRFAVRMEGQSMDKTIPPGSELEVLWIKFTDIKAQPGDLVIVERQRHDLTEMTCKRLALEDGVLVLRAESTRPEWSEPIMVGEPSKDSISDDGVRIIGIVLNSQQQHSHRRFN